MLVDRLPWVTLMVEFEKITPWTLNGEVLFRGVMWWY